MALELRIILINVFTITAFEEKTANKTSFLTAAIEITKRNVQKKFYLKKLC